MEWVVRRTHLYLQGRRSDQLLTWPFKFARDLLSDASAVAPGHGNTSINTEDRVLTPSAVHCFGLLFSKILRMCKRSDC